MGVSGIVKGVEHFLEGDDLFGLLINGFPHNAVGALAHPLQDVELLEDMGFHFFSHGFIFVC